MKKLGSLMLLLATFFMVSCSDNEPNLLTEEQVNEAFKDKMVYQVGFSASDELEPDFGSEVTVYYVEGDNAFFQTLSIEDGLGEAKQAGIYGKFDSKRYVPIKFEFKKFFNFNSEKAVKEAVETIKKESPDTYDFFMVYNISAVSYNDYAMQKKGIEIDMTIHTTKKGEASYKHGRSKVTNYYKFNFDVLEDSSVKLK